MTSQVQPLKTSWVRRYLELAAALATIVGLGATIYFALKADREKKLDVTYLAKLSLVNPTATSKERVKVSYEGRDIRELVQISIRIVNSGSLPIEKRDIEEPITFPFGNATVLAAAVVRSVPANIQAAIVSEPRSVVVQHGLLNSGDYVEFEVLCDGDPGWPTPTFRITGVREGRITIPADRPAVIRPAYINLSRPMELTVLAITSLVPLLFVALAVMAFATEIMPVVYPAARLRRAIRIQRANAVNDERLPQVLADSVYRALPPGPDQAASEKVRALKYESQPGEESTAEFLDRAERVALEAVQIALWRRLKWIHWG
jgi:hypothetical protein